ncbi:hypothetical protein HS088_TW14G00393 [Tripterygium wilfordii]|uniref:DUF1685 family protein n=1 Tax=Tripterygium wilfordii TaxID=458696 RepID=A0A7J7CQ72_TRIWF|nr:uncharacterized protein LOC120014503 [Tripterygium wilfordii]KAF5736255.1 hypothetical protein HS088_TW14G00393 [Tripterygium wilfordii]
MDAGQVIELYDSSWFEKQIFSKLPVLPSSSNLGSIPDQENQEETPKYEISRTPSLHRRSVSHDQLSTSLTSFNSGSFSPDSIIRAPKLNTILSGKAITEEDYKSAATQRLHIQVGSPHKKKKNDYSTSRRNKGTSKSLSDLEFEELKGFMDLGFVFSEEDKDSRLASIIPGLQRMGKQEDEEEKDSGVDQSKVSRPYLSEAWEVLDRRRKAEKLPWIEWKIPIAGNEIDMKDNLRLWAHSVASTVR